MSSSPRRIRTVEVAFAETLALSIILLIRALAPLKDLLRFSIYDEAIDSDKKVVMVKAALFLLAALVAWTKAERIASRIANTREAPDPTGTESLVAAVFKAGGVALIAFQISALVYVSVRFVAPVGWESQTLRARGLGLVDGGHYFAKALLGVWMVARAGAIAKGRAWRDVLPGDVAE